MRLLVALCAMLAVVVASGAPTVRLSTGLLQGQVNGAANQYLGTYAVLTILRDRVENGQCITPIYTLCYLASNLDVPE